MIACKVISFFRKGTVGLDLRFRAQFSHLVPFVVTYFDV